MWRVINMGALILLAAVGIAVMQLKFAVKEKREAVEALAEDIRRDREVLRVLQAEWALLASPGMLQERSYRFLALMPVRPDQIIESPYAIPMRRAGVEADGDTTILLPTKGKVGEEIEGTKRPGPKRSETKRSGTKRSETKRLGGASEASPELSSKEEGGV